jgi:hypothetical protein
MSPLATHPIRERIGQGVNGMHNYLIVMMTGVAWSLLGSNLDRINMALLIFA